MTAYEPTPEMVEAAARIIRDSTVGIDWRQGAGEGDYELASHIFALVPAADDDEATVERVAEAIYCGDTCYSDAWASQSPAIHDYYRPIARAALAAIPAPPPDEKLADHMRRVGWTDRQIGAAMDAAGAAS